jgi:hypothetical protein
MSDKKPSLIDIEEAALYADDYPEVPPTDIVAFNELRSCADLFRMYDQGILEIQPDFQRDVVWSGPAQTRFVDSLIKQLPIPSMCFAQDNRKQKWIVIDGLQRISTIVRFLVGGDWTLSKLDDIDQALAGKAVAQIKDKKSPDHHYYTRVENLTIPITVLRCDLDRQKHLEYLFTIFHRLNTGGMKLNNQEIRNCIYGGSLNNLLKELDSGTTWRKLNRMKPRNNYRLTKQELILRAFAFTDRLEEYTGHLAKFLNDYMHANRNADAVFVSRQRERFENVVELIFDGVFRGETTPRLSTTLLEAVLVGVGRNVATIHAHTDLAARFQQLKADPAFSEESLTEGLSKRQRVIDRLTRAVKIFGGRS